MQRIRVALLLLLIGQMMLSRTIVFRVGPRNGPPFQRVSLMLEPAPIRSWRT